MEAFASEENQQANRAATDPGYLESPSATNVPVCYCYSSQSPPSAAAQGAAGLGTGRYPLWGVSSLCCVVLWFRHGEACSALCWVAGFLVGSRVGYQALPVVVFSAVVLCCVVVAVRSGGCGRGKVVMVEGVVVVVMVVVAVLAPPPQ